MFSLKVLNILCDNATVGGALCDESTSIEKTLSSKQFLFYYFQDSVTVTFYHNFNTFCYCVQKKSIKGVLLHFNENRHPNGLDENLHLV